MSLFGTSGRGRALSARKTHVVSVLDIGSSKIVCMIARLTPRAESQILPGRTHNIEIIGIGHQRSQGIKSGVIVNLDAAEAGRPSGGRCRRTHGRHHHRQPDRQCFGRSVEKRYLYRGQSILAGRTLIRATCAVYFRRFSRRSVNDERQVLHSVPAGFTLDGERGIRDPLGMYGETLGVDLHVVSAERLALRNLELCVNRAHLSVERMVATPYASGLAALVDDEVELGCAAIDMGAGTTTISVFSEGKLVHTDAISLGGHHVTTDLARGLSTRMEDAERLKCVHGSTVSSSADERDMIAVPSIGEDDQGEQRQVSKAILSKIVRARVEETLELIRDRIQLSGFSAVVGKRVVLTGGASQLIGLSELARRILSRNVRIGRPMGVSGLPVAAKGPAFAAATGLLIYPQLAENETYGSDQRGFLSSGGGRLARVGQWLKESF